MIGTIINGAAPPAQAPDLERKGRLRAAGAGAKGPEDRWTGKRQGGLSPETLAEIEERLKRL